MRLKPGGGGHRRSLHTEMTAHYRDGNQLCANRPVLHPTASEQIHKHTTHLPFIQPTLMLSCAAMERKKGQGRSEAGDEDAGALVILLFLFSLHQFFLALNGAFIALSPKRIVWVAR